MDLPMFRNKTVMQHDFSMVPRSNIPRSVFRRQPRYTTTLDSGYLIPVHLREVYPGDSFNVNMTAFARLTTAIKPIMDNLYLDSFFFFVPNRLVWTHWVNMMGEQANPGDSISYTIPQCSSAANGYAVNSVQDYFGLGTVGQVTATKLCTHSNLPLRGYNLIWNTWFRDENLQNSVTVDTGDGPDTYTNYNLLRRGKRHDYFTSCLPWPQKGSTAVSLPLGTSAPVFGTGVSLGLFDGTSQGGMGGNGFTGLTGWLGAAPGAATSGSAIGASKAVGFITKAQAGGTPANSGLYADLSSATAATINAIRLAVATQQLLETDARGGTRYVEINLAHFGVRSPDARLQRPEYLGGGSTPILISPIAQTSGTSASGTTTPLGNLAATGSVVARHGYTKSFVEHGYVIGLVSVRADLSYQQGVNRHWFRSSRYDFYFPAFANIGEQSVLNREIYFTGDTTDTSVWGYQEPWAELRYEPSLITGQFRSTYSTPLDVWHLAQKFTSLPTLNSTFIQDNPPVDRVIAVTAVGSQFYFDARFDEVVARPLPQYGVPGLTRF